MHTLLTPDGVRLRVLHERPLETASTVVPGLAYVVAHGFTGSLDRPNVQTVIARLRSYGGVVGLDFRGHGRSSGVTSVGDREIDDLATTVSWARLLGYERVATVGFSMGGAIVIRQAALLGGVDAVVSVSAPAWWWFRGTPSMRRVHWLIETRAGRTVSRVSRRTRIDAGGWPQTPLAPFEVVGRIAPVPLLIVHGTADAFLPVAHARRLYEAAGSPRELWIREGVGHAEGAVDAVLLAEIATWAADAARSVASRPASAVGEDD